MAKPQLKPPRAIRYVLRDMLMYSNLPPSVKETGYTLIAPMSDDYNPTMSHLGLRTIAKRLKKAIRTVRRDIDILVAVGLFTITTGKQGRSEYHLNGAWQGVGLTAEDREVIRDCPAPAEGDRAQSSTSPQGQPDRAQSGNGTVRNPAPDRAQLRPRPCAIRLYELQGSTDEPLQEELGANEEEGESGILAEVDALADPDPLASPSTPTAPAAQRPPAHEFDF